jgi:hypothetical protein
MIQQRYFSNGDTHDARADRPRAEQLQSVAPIASKAADVFYDRLFEIALVVRSLFPADLSGQKVKLIAMLATAVNNLHQLPPFRRRFANSEAGIADMA